MTIKGQTGTELAVIGKVRKHRFQGPDPVRCDKCSKAFSAVAHK